MIGDLVASRTPTGWPCSATPARRVPADPSPGIVSCWGGCSTTSACAGACAARTARGDAPDRVMLWPRPHPGHPR
ncbi:hypothetical protein HBB16_07025 [Pseudonocardia sp. MCCB 268]|nr:hypothetical protein [Pseudonocardia cytotoxica]